MFSSRIARMAVIGLLLAAGVWLLGRSARLTPESAARQQAVAAYAPDSGARLTSLEAWGPGPVSGVARPVPVDLRKIPPGLYDADNQLAR
ncbi:MAG TPA: hypothetical protein VK879_03405 [Candidatus Sulfomarinibacteraceae bacterium]|nr:hypothetical protein [Candidatus Sulfomarinibacteraceae bacterium]